MPKGSSVWLRGLLMVLAIVNTAAARAAEGDFNEGLDAYLVGNYAKALNIWAPLAESGDEVAAFNMGVLYAQGLGVEADAARAIRWYRQSAESGYAPAQFNLGSAYMQGAGVEPDKRLAAQWWEKAAAQDYSHALFNLATLYLGGNGVTRDEDKARQLYQRAAALGDLRAQRVLEQMVLASPTMLADEGAAPAASAPPVDARGGADDVTAASAAGRPGATRAQAPDPAAAGGVPGEATPGSGAQAAAQRAGAAQAEPVAGGSGTDRLRRQDPAHYTVQLFAFSDLGSAQKYARETGMAEELMIARASTQGRTWYKAFYGSYPDLAQAKAARDRLQPRVGRHVPWVRRIRDVHAELVDAPAEAAAPAPDGDASQAERAVSAKVTTTAAGRQSITLDRAVSPQRHAAADRPAEGPPPSGAAGQAATGQARETALEAPRMEPRLVPEADDGQQLQEGQSFFNRQDYARALEAWRPLAAKGIAQAQYGLGFMYESGWGVERDYEQAFIWYERAARQGHAQSQYNLGMLFHNGLGVKRSAAKALFWIQNAADGGDPRAGEYIQRATSN